MSAKMIPINDENSDFPFNPHVRRNKDKRIIMRPNINTLEAEMIEIGPK